MTRPAREIDLAVRREAERERRRQRADAQLLEQARQARRRLDRTEQGQRPRRSGRGFPFLSPQQRAGRRGR